MLIRSRFLFILFISYAPLFSMNSNWHLAFAKDTEKEFFPHTHMYRFAHPNWSGSAHELYIQMAMTIAGSLKESNKYSTDDLMRALCFLTGEQPPLPSYHYTVEEMNQKVSKTLSNLKEIRQRVVSVSDDMSQLTEQQAADILEIAKGRIACVLARRVDAITKN